MKLVSIIIPIYNVEKYLEECLESVINQTYKFLEIICVDDGSTDLSKEILNNYSTCDSRIIAIFKNNGGLSSARNEALKYVKGDYFMFLDSDDFLELDAIDNIVKVAENYYLDTVWIPYNSFHHGSRTTNSIQFPLNVNTIMNGKEFLCENISIAAGGVPHLFLKASPKTLSNYFIEGILHEDHTYCFESLISSKRLYALSKAYYQRRIRECSIMTTRHFKKSVEGCIETMLFIAETYGTDEYYFSKLYIRRLYSPLSSYVLDGYYDGKESLVNSFTKLKNAIRKYKQFWFLEMILMVYFPKIFCVFCKTIRGRMLFPEYRLSILKKEAMSSLRK